MPNIQIIASALAIVVGIGIYLFESRRRNNDFTYSTQPPSNQDYHEKCDSEAHEFRQKQNREEQSQGEKCAICREFNTNYITKCRHSFHVACLLEWKKYKSICPICSQSIILW